MKEVTQMPTVFEEYAPYRPAVTDDEQELLDEGRMNQEELLADPTVKHWARGWIDAEGRLAPYPLQHNQMQIALDRADQQLRRWGADPALFPVDADTTVRFPGVDPKGKACEVDMAFAQRRARLEAALSSRPPEVRAYVERQLKDLTQLNTPMRQAWDKMKIDCYDIRMTTLAARMAVTEETSRWLLEDAQARKGSAAITRVGGVLNVLEYLSGLTDREPTQQERTLMAELKAPVTPEVERHRADSLTAPEHIAVEFENFDHQVQQKFFCDPRNWGKGPRHMPEDIVNLDAALGAVSRYSKATADRAISPLFEAMEKKTRGVISRGDLITVDGKTIREKMCEDYVAAGKNLREFDAFYKRNVREAASSYVSAALMAGKRVEAFVPDSQGRIPDEPTQITKAGYEPSPLKKVTLNAWQRHFARYGFYKEKAARADEYRRVMEARQRVKSTNLSAQLEMDGGIYPHVKEQFFGDWSRENGPLPTKVPDGFSVTRSGLTTFAICRLAAQGHSIEAIYDPAQLQAEKQAAGKEVLEHLMAGDKKWAGETLFRGQERLLADVDRLTANMDFSDDRQILNSANRPLFFGAYALFDAGQEERRCEEEVLTAAERFHPGKGKQELDRISAGGNCVSTFFSIASQSLDHINKYSAGVTDRGSVNMGIDRILCYEAAKQVFARKRAEAPGRPMSQFMKLDGMAECFAYGYSLNRSQKEPLYRLAEQEGDVQRSLGRELQSGRLQTRFRIKTDPEMRDFSFGLPPPAKRAVKEENQAKRVEEAVQKNTAKAGGGRTR